MNETVVYLDILFFNNLFSDFLLLFLVAILLKEKLRWARMVFSAAFGALYACAAFFPNLSFLGVFLFKITVSIFMVVLAFKPLKIFSAVKQTLIFYLLSFALYGGMSALYFFTPLSAATDFLQKNGVYYIDGSFYSFFLLMSVSAIIVYAAGRTFYEKRRISSFICDVFVKTPLGEKKLRGFLDSGNHLKSPITLEGISVLKVDEAYGLLPEEAIKQAKKYLKGEISESENFFASLESAKIKNLGVIPFETVGEKDGLFLSFRALEVRIKIDTEEIQRKNFPVVLCGSDFQNSASYELLLPSELLDLSNK